MPDNKDTLEITGKMKVLALRYATIHNSKMQIQLDINPRVKHVVFKRLDIMEKN